MKEIPFEIDTLKRLIRFVLSYHEKMLTSSLRQTGFWYQDDWVDYEMAYDHSQVRREKRRYEKEIRRVKHFLEREILLIYEDEGYSPADTNELKYYLQFHYDSIIGWMQVRQTIESPKFRWDQLDSNRQQMYYEDSDIAAGLMMSELQIEDPQTIIDMYAFVLNSCSYLVVRDKTDVGKSGFVSAGGDETQYEQR